MDKVYEKQNLSLNQLIENQQNQLESLKKLNDATGMYTSQVSEAQLALDKLSSAKTAENNAELTNTPIGKRASVINNRLQTYTKTIQSAAIDRDKILLNKDSSKEEKELACAFIETLLSYDSQINMIADHNFGFSVRNDVLKEQLEQADFSHGIYVRSLGDVDISKVKKDDVDAIFGNLVKNVRFDNIYSKEMLNVILEEVGNYFNDIISIDDATKNLSNRVGIFLAESE